MISNILLYMNVPCLFSHEHVYRYTNLNCKFKTSTDKTKADKHDKTVFVIRNELSNCTQFGIVTSLMISAVMFSFGIHNAALFVPSLAYCLSLYYAFAFNLRMCLWRIKLENKRL